MNTDPRNTFRPCVPGALNGGLTRTAFFDGMVLSEADMQREQNYWGMKRKLTNRALGNGVVWGLNMTWDKKQRCFTLCPGYGISCCGDDLVVECPETLCERDLIDPCAPEFRRLFADKTDPCDDCDSDPKAPIEACLYLEYVECPEDPRQVFEDPCAQSPQDCRFGAVRETTRLRLVAPPPPPPPGPIERFYEKIEGIKAELAASGVVLPDTMLSNAGTARAGIAVGGAVANGQKSEESQIDLAEDAMGKVAVTGLSGAVVTLRITPPPCYMITRVERDGHTISDMSILMGVNFERTTAELSTTAGINEQVTIEFAPLLGMGRTKVAVFDVQAAVVDSTANMTVTTRAFDEIESRKDCLSHFSDGIRLATGNTSQTLRTLALAVLTGWFKGMLGTPVCCPETAQDGDRARMLLAWLVAWLAWVVLWGIDIRDDRAKGVQKCLQKLFSWWCDGLHYKGPTCDCDAHGIYLGCVKISPKGKIICFDEWKHRRYVLTGPLLTHWGSQFGLAPIDVTATRIAGWICCVAKTDIATFDKGDFAALGGRIDLLGGSFGTFGQAAQSVTVNGHPVASSHDVSALDFIGVVLKQINGNAAVPTKNAQAYNVVTSREMGLELAMPSSTVQAKEDLRRERSIAHEVLAAKLADMPPMAREPAGDFINSIAERVTLSELKLPDGSQDLTALVEALETAEIATIADLMDAGPETALARARTAISASADLHGPRKAEIAMNHVFKAAQSTASRAGDAVAEDAAERSDDDPFVRENLNDVGTLASIRRAVNKTLRGRGLSAADVRSVAADAVALRR